MKFKTIVLTGKKTAAILAAVACLVSALVFFVCVKGAGKIISHIGGDYSDYESIIDEGVGAGESMSMKDLIYKLTGIDAERAETIIPRYSASLAGTTPSYVAEDNIELPAEDETGNTTEAELPSHDEICASGGLSISNATTYSVNLDELCAGELSVKADSTDEPVVLVMHTHTTECYMGDEMSGESERTTDESRNVIAVGNEICSVLESYGIKTVHDTTYHDYPSYQGSYTRALATVENRLKEYPSVKAVLDIHRDAFVYPDGSRLRVACDIDGEETAQAMLVVGTDSMGLWHENWRENLKFAAKIQNAAEIMYPGLMRPVNLRRERFNGHTTRGSLIIEVGSNGNTLDEAVRSGHDVARAVAAAIING